MVEYFPDIPKIKYEGKNSNNDLAFKYYNPIKLIGNISMKKYLRFSVNFWHTFNYRGRDLFGDETMIRSWDDIDNSYKLARVKIKAAFEFMQKLGVEYFCFHDRDIAPIGTSLKETNIYLDKIVKLLVELMNETGIKLLWGTSNLFSHKIYVHGAATSPNPDVFAYAAAQVKKALDITNKLKGKNFVFWGGREGYDTLLNTNMNLELDNLARFLKMAVNYAKKIGFKGQLLIEPKPKEPTNHQYDFDVATVIGFLRKYNLDNYFKLNIEANHSTLAGHSFQHELCYARINDMLGSIDANEGDKLIGWDIDKFPANIYNTTLAMYEILKNNGLKYGGINFDAKVRRGSFDQKDLFYGYISGMDSYAKGLMIANKILKEGKIEDFISKRYKYYNEGIGKKIVQNKVGFEQLEKYILRKEDILNFSGREEKLKRILNQYIIG